MFNKILAVVLLSASLYSANVINSNVYTKSSSVEVHFSLDDPFVGSGDFTKKNKITFIHIPSIFIKNPKEILKESNLIMFLRVFPTDEGMLIKIKEKAGIDIDISKSNDLYTLKVVISKKPSSKYQLGKYKVDDKELGS
ncbi:MAG: hypothetical protein OIF32_07395, partial [Campylobacterales bacterium]|nr:hypothetical protein [Campylobacterales bacterium]